MPPAWSTVRVVGKILRPYLKKKDIRYKLIKYRHFGVREEYRNFKEPDEAYMEELRKTAEEEVNVITYGTGRPKLDIRKWNRAEDKMQKGITLDKEEALALFEALQDFDFEKLG